MHLLLVMGGGGMYVSWQEEAPYQSAFSFGKMVVKVEAAVTATAEEGDDEGETQWFA